MILHPRHLWMTWSALLIFWALRSPGVTIEQSLVLEQSGGLKASYIYEIPNSAAGLLTGLQRTVSSRVNAASSGGVLDEASVRRQFSGIRGVYMESYTRFQLEDRQRVEFSVVALDAPVALESGAFGAFHYTSSENPSDGGELELTMPPDEMREAVNPDHATRLAELLGGFQLKLTITAPSTIHKDSTGQEDGPFRRQWQLSLPELLSKELPIVRVKW